MVRNQVGVIISMILVSSFVYTAEYETKENYGDNSHRPIRTMSLQELARREDSVNKQVNTLYKKSCDIYGKRVMSQCSECQNIYSDLKSHLKVAHVHDNDLYVCHCGRAYSSRSHLRTHLMNYVARWDDATQAALDRAALDKALEAAYPKVSRNGRQKDLLVKSNREQQSQLLANAERIDLQKRDGLKFLPRWYSSEDIEQAQLQQDVCVSEDDV